jgi:uncharacterized protein (UPF0335 family)
MKSDIVAIDRKIDSIASEQRNIKEKIERVECSVKSLSSDIDRVFGVMELFADLFDRKENCDLAKRVEKVKNGLIESS